MWSSARAGNSVYRTFGAIRRTDRSSRAGLG
jgi:hypothetical protein